MANEEDGSVYHSLSRKDLQSLCKKYGLPANRSSSDMAKSVGSYLEKQRLGSMTPTERLYGVEEAGLPLSWKLQLQSGASLNSFSDAVKDCYGLISCPTGRCNGGNYSQATSCNALGCCTGDKFYHKDEYGGSSIFFQQTPQSQFGTQYDNSGSNDKEFPTISFNENYLSFTRDGRMNNMPQIQQRDTNVGACSHENAFPSSQNTPTVSPSFQFHVSSEEGINLYVDLNSNPSEWVEKLKSEVSICQNMAQSKSETFHEELGRFEETSKQMKSSFLLNVDAGKQKDGHINSGLPPSLIIKENNSLQLDHPDGGDQSLGSTVIMPSARAVDVSEHSEGDQGVTLFKVHSDSQEQIIPDGVSSAKDGCLMTLDSKINSPGEKLVCDAVSNKSDGPLNLLSTELQDHICENSTPQSGCNIWSPGGIIPGCLLDGSLQMPTVHQKDALDSPCENIEFVDLADPKHNIDAEQGALSGSTELEQEAYRNRLPTLVEGQDRSKIINREESLDCSQSQEELFENSGGLDVDVVESNGLGKKRANIECDQNDCSKPYGKILSSTTNHLIRKVLPRRSLWLVSKVLFKSFPLSTQLFVAFATPVI